MRCVRRRCGGKANAIHSGKMKNIDNIECVYWSKDKNQCFLSCQRRLRLRLICTTDLCCHLFGLHLLADVVIEFARGCAK